MESMYWITMTVLLSLPYLSEGLKCYHCDSTRNNETCGERPTLSPSDTALIREDCRACAKGSYRSAMTVVFSRRCSNITTAVEGCEEVKKKSQFTYEQVQCFCLQDLCNSAVRTNTDTAVFAICSLILMYLTQ